jgi:hypothetical protein
MEFYINQYVRLTDDWIRKDEPQVSKSLSMIH